MSTWRKFVLFGDSITQYAFEPHGWGSALADTLQRKADVLNRGFSGYNTDHALDMLPEVFPAGSLTTQDVITIFFGANDAALPDLTQLHVPLQRYESNLEKIIDYFKEMGLPTNQIILIAPTPVDDETWLKIMPEKQDRKNETTKLYADGCRRVALKHSCIFVDTWSSFMKGKDYGKLLNDGLHLSDIGSRKFASLLLPHVIRISSNWQTNYRDWTELFS